MVSRGRNRVNSDCCGGRVSYVFRSPYYGNSSVLIYFVGGDALGSSLLFLPGGCGQPSRRFPSESVVFACGWAKKGVLAVTSAGHHLSSRWCGPNLTVGAYRVTRSIYLRWCGVDRDLSIETAPDGCDDARIKLH